jgi:hypothetical protein
LQIEEKVRLDRQRVYERKGKKKTEKQMEATSWGGTVDEKGALSASLALECLVQHSTAAASIDDGSPFSLEHFSRFLRYRYPSHEHAECTVS